MDRHFPKKEEVIRLLGLEPLTGEGGMWAQPYSSDETLPAGTLEGRPTDRPVCSTIYYLLAPGTFSCMHRLVTDEIWYYHLGPAAEMLLIYPCGKVEIKRLGPDLAAGERPQITVPRGTWQGARMGGEGEYTLMSTSMAPGYMDTDFTAGTCEELLPLATGDYERELLEYLTQKPRY